ncbi:MAG TPA: hypothetical protein VMM37_07840 [Bacteroidota bacterium]|nr:hypothetical protein [Bacteroidota bacterium]
MKRILFICGTMNQATQMLQIAGELPEYDRVFSPQYCDGFLELVRPLGWLDFTTPGNPWVRKISQFLADHSLQEDYRGLQGQYDLVLIPTDLIIPRNILNSHIVLVQEGMTDPENFAFHLVKSVRFLPRWIASSAASGLSDLYDVFCVASDGYRELFIRKGVKPEKIVVTGIPNFDHCSQYLVNDFPYRDYVLVCTSDARETFKIENRARFIRRCVDIAAGRPLLFKLHPNENKDRARREIERIAPDALVFAEGRTEEMIANCRVLITQYSSVVYVGMALGKEVHSYFDVRELRRLMPVQNASAAKNIASLCRNVLESGEAPVRQGKLELAS